MLETISTAANYDETYAVAMPLLAAAVGPFATEDTVEAEKVLRDRLNDAWTDGITVAEWVRRAAAQYPAQ